MTAKDEYLVVKKQKEFDKKLKKIKAKYDKEIKSLIAKVQEDGCKHTYFSTYDQRFDNGYGKWHTSVIKRCKVCKQEAIYEEWPLT